MVACLVLCQGFYLFVKSAHQKDCSPPDTTLHRQSVSFFDIICGLIHILDVMRILVFNTKLYNNKTPHKVIF